jgi:signal transduction histidine kinase
MLARLGIGQKLVALAALPMVAVLLTMTPFIVERVGDARLARATAEATSTARDVGAFIQDLQRERLLALAYLTSTQLDRTALVAQTATANADLAQLRTRARTMAVVQRAERSLSNLAAVRTLFLDRGITPETAYQAYRRAIADLIDQLRLTNPPDADAEGVRQLQALDALARANEEAASVGATLIATAGDERFPVDLVNQATTAQVQYSDQLAKLVEPDQAALLGQMESGQAADRISQLVGTVNRPDRGSGDVTVADALSAAVSYTTLRQVAQDRITRDVASGATGRSTTAQRVAIGIGVAGLLLLLLVFWLARTISTSIARPLRQLTRAATDVAALTQRHLVRIADTDVDDPTPLRLPDVDITSPDEIGALAAAFNQVQTTAAALVEQQAHSRRNVAVMFANIARRTQNLVGRQRSQMQALRRLVTDPRAAEQLARLDQQRTQLRRSADSLLVVSGIVDQGAGGSPALLADVIAGVRGDLGPDAEIQVTMVAPVTITAGFVDDLRLILGELLANAVNFSPPGSPVQLGAELREELAIRLVDHGLGLTEDRLAEENRRLVDRERLDIAPTSVLGLFVVGRLARRHNLRVRLEPTPGGGLTAMLWVPADLFRPAAAVDVVRRTVDVAPVQRGGAGLDAQHLFDWFGPAAGTAELPALPPAWPPRANGNGTHQADAPPRPAAWPAPPPPPSTPYLPAAISDAWPVVELPPPAPRPAAPAPQVETRAGLTRRRPGQHMVPGLLAPTPAQPAPRAQQRDPESERAQLNNLFAGFQRGETAQQPPIPSAPAVERPS